MAKAIHQIVANIRSGDAVGNTALETRSALRRLGYESEIFCEQSSPDLKDSVLPVGQYLEFSSAESLLLFHYSTGTESARFVYNLPDRKVMIYHNISPPEYFLGIHDHVVGELYHGRKQLAEFKDKVELAVGDSEFNEQELKQLGYRSTAVLPLALNFDDLDQEPDLFIRKAYSDHKLNFLFVGRIVPNKGIEDLIKLYAHFKKFVSHDSRLIIVGDWSGFDRYRNQLLQLVDSIDLPDVVMTGRVTFKQLLAFYSVANAYISMSNHEGFCVPLLEAMHFGVPVMAKAAAAVPETMDGAGVLVQKLDYAECAEMLAEMTSGGLLQQRIIDSQHQRLERYKAKSFEDSLKNLLNILEYTP